MRPTVSGSFINVREELGFRTADGFGLTAGNKDYGSLSMARATLIKFLGLIGSTTV